jgi:hypothetical protein
MCALFTLLLTSCSRTETFPVRTYPMGQRVEIGKLVYTVFETQWLPQIGEGTSARVPQHRFFLIRLSAVNGGSDEVMVPNFTIQDSAGKTYEEQRNGDGVPQWMGFLRQAKPAEPVQGNVLFDAPPGRYLLRVTDETGDRAALIDIPLSFGAETPEVPIPGDGKKH